MALSITSTDSFEITNQNLYSLSEIAFDTLIDAIYNVIGQNHLGFLSVVPKLLFDVTKEMSEVNVEELKK